MKVVGIVGYKGSGKTTLARALARELTARGCRVAVVKHTSHPIDLPGKDSAVLGAVAGQVAIIAPGEAAVFWKRPLGLEDILAHLEADVVLVEGFKGEKRYPKIACLRGQPDDADLLAGLLDEAVFAVVGPVGRVAALGAYNVIDRDDVAQIAELVERLP